MPDHETTLGDDLDRLAELELAEQEASDALDTAKQARETFERSVYARMHDEGWKPGSSLNRNGFVFRPTATVFATVQDATDLREYLKAQEAADPEDDFDYGGMVEPKFKKGELNRLVRRKIENGEPLPPGLGSYERTRVAKSGITASKHKQEDDDDEG